MPAAQLSLFHSCPRLFEDCDESVLHQMGSCPCTKYSMVCKPTSPSDALLGPFLPIREELERGAMSALPQRTRRSFVRLFISPKLNLLVRVFCPGSLASSAQVLGPSGAGAMIVAPQTHLEARQ